MQHDTGGFPQGDGRFVGASFFFVVVVVATRTEISFPSEVWGFVEPGPVHTADDAHRRPWLTNSNTRTRIALLPKRCGWVMCRCVRAMIFSFVPLHCLLFLGPHAAVGFKGRKVLSPPLYVDHEWLLYTRIPCSCRAVALAAVGA